MKMEKVHNKIKVLAIGTDCISLFTKEHEEFIGYVGKNMFYFDSETLKRYKLYENQLLNEFRPMVHNSEMKLNEIKFIKLTTN
jgi:hypothetical protein